MSGEYGHRKGTDFEQSTKVMLTYLGYKIQAESTSVKCLDPNHRLSEHSIDVLAEHVGPVPRPHESHDGLTFFDMTSSEKISRESFLRTSKTLQCLRKDSRYARTKGAVFVTRAKLTPPISEEMRSIPGIKCWDGDRLSLYGRLAELFPHHRQCRYHSENGVTIVLYDPSRGDPLPPKHVFAELFYEGEARLNQDTLKSALLRINKMTRFPTTTIHVNVRSLQGFTKDVMITVEEAVRECSSWSRKIDITREELFDYTCPWFPRIRD